MLGILVKKQLAEVFRSYFYDQKKNKMRSKLAIAAWFVFFVLIMVGMLGGIFAGLSYTLCAPLTGMGLGWLYFLLMGVIAVVLGAFGSVFNTYSGLYLAKDNDLLLSLPIPVKTIVAARLINVYLLGAMYSATVILPALLIYWYFAGATAARVICGVLLMLIITFIVLLLSCALGWVVAKISQKLKNKSFITVLVSLAFIAAYYFFYFKANLFIQTMIANAMTYEAKIRGGAYALYLFGRIGEGDWLSAAAFGAATALLTAGMWRLLSRSFLSVTSDGGAAKVRYREKAVKEKRPFAALLAKEFARFTSSANYMLNAGLGVLLIPVGGVLLLFQGRTICALLDEVFAARQGCSAVLLFVMLCMLSSMNDMAVPSVSLEGKSLWIPQSLPVAAKQVLRAKASVQLILTGVPLLFAGICAACVVNASPAVKLLLIAASLSYGAFSALFGAVIGLKMPVLNWTSELAPIKQSGAVAIILFGSWIMSMVLAGAYLLAGYKMGPAAYLLLCTAVFTAASLLCLRWLDTRGAAVFAAL